MFDHKKIPVSVSGRSYKSVFGNSEAIGVIVQTLLDNALKYFSKNKKVEVYVSDEEEGIMFSVSSYGPLIKRDEQERIFEPFYRGEEAQKAEEEGAGYGLYIAKMIAKKIGANITVDQETTQESQSGYLTIFSVNIPSQEYDV